MNMNLIIGKIAIWIGIVVQIFYNVYIVRWTTFMIFISAEGASPEIADSIALVIIAIISLPLVLTAINLENKMEVKGALFIVYAIVALCMTNYFSTLLWIASGIFLIWTKYSKDESTDEDENKKKFDNKTIDIHLDSSEILTKINTDSNQALHTEDTRTELESKNMSEPTEFKNIATKNGG